MAEILVSDLSGMSADELRLMRVIKLKDPENLTSEHVEKLRQILDGLDESRGLDLEAVNKKLWKLTEATPAEPDPISRYSPSPTPDANDPVHKEAVRQENIRRELKAYRNLIEDGGQPSHQPDDSGFEFLEDPQNRTDIVTYWIAICRDDVEVILDQQWWLWGKFRDYQDRMRAKFWKKEWFPIYIQGVKDYRQKKGLEGDICLLQDRKQQSRLDDWKEYQIYQHMEADRLMKRIERDAKDVKLLEAGVQPAAEGVEWLKEVGLYDDDARRSVWEIDLERQTVLLNWIDEQLPVIAYECDLADSCSHSPDNQSTSNDNTTAKWKRSSAVINHTRSVRRRVEFEESTRPSSAIENETSRNPTTSLRSRPEPKSGNRYNLRPRQPRKSMQQNKHSSLNLRDNSVVSDTAERANRTSMRSSKAPSSRKSKARTEEPEFQLARTSQPSKDVLPKSSGRHHRRTALKLEKEHNTSLKLRRSERISQRLRN